jgi:hypothetical protein
MSVQYDTTSNAYTFTLSHNEEIEFLEVPYGYDCKITENMSDDDSYTPYYTVTGSTTETQNGTCEFKFTAPTVVAFRNDKSIKTPTGLFTDRLPYLLMVSLATLALMGHTLSAYRRRKHDSE